MSAYILIHAYAAKEYKKSASEFSFCSPFVYFWKTTDFALRFAIAFLHFTSFSVHASESSIIIVYIFPAVQLQLASPRAHKNLSSSIIKMMMKTKKKALHIMTLFFWCSFRSSEASFIILILFSRFEVLVSFHLLARNKKRAFWRKHESLQTPTTIGTEWFSLFFRNTSTEF